MAYKIPSKHSIDLYNQLVNKQNKVRKVLRKIHKNAEEVSGVGRLPALIIPKSARRISRDYFSGINKNELKRRLRLFWGKYKEAQKLFKNGLPSYLDKTVKQGYLELWRDQILFISGESPEGQFGRFSSEQIEGSFMGDFMEVYNMMNQLSPSVFLALLYSGRIIQFKFIYHDMAEGTGGRENSWLQQQKEQLAIYGSPKARKELLETMKDVVPSKELQKSYYNDEDEEARSYIGKHTDKTLNKAEKKGGK